MVNSTATPLGSASSTKKLLCSSSVSIGVLILCNLLVFQVTYTWTVSRSNTNVAAVETFMSLPQQQQQQQPQQQQQQQQSSPLAIPQGAAVALPSIRESSKDGNKVINRKIYGGQGDKKHLGGFTDIDLHGVTPATWKLMVEYFGIKSLLDVGCGRGISTSWFALHGIETLCVEGSHDAVEKTMVPRADQIVTEHDFSRGPWWPSRTVDAVWAVEFLEHVGRNFQQNYIPAFRKAAFVFCTNSQWGGWHHVEVHPDAWWIAKMQSYGFVYSDYLTQMVRQTAQNESRQRLQSPKPGEKYNAQHVAMTMKVFINPAVASLPEHQHLFAQEGCFLKRENGVIHNKPCGTGRDGDQHTPMDPAYLPIQLTPDMDKAWVSLVQKNIATNAS